MKSHDTPSIKIMQVDAVVLSAKFESYINTPTWSVMEKLYNNYYH